MIWLAHSLLTVPVRAVVMAVATLPIPCAYGHSALDRAPAIQAMTPAYAVTSSHGLQPGELAGMRPGPTAAQGPAGHLILTGKSHTSFGVAISGDGRW